MFTDGSNCVSPFPQTFMCGDEASCVSASIVRSLLKGFGNFNVSCHFLVVVAVLSCLVIPFWKPYVILETVKNTKFFITLEWSSI